MKIGAGFGAFFGTGLLPAGGLDFVGAASKLGFRISVGDETLFDRCAFRRVYDAGAGVTRFRMASTGFCASSTKCDSSWRGGRFSLVLTDVSQERVVVFDEEFCLA